MQGSERPKICLRSRFQNRNSSAVDVMVSKMDSCMVDLVDFHTRALQQIQTEQAEQETKAEKVEEEVPQSTAVESDEEFQTPSSTLESPEMERAPSQGFDFSARRQQQDTGFLAVLRRSFGYTALPSILFLLCGVW